MKNSKYIYIASGDKVEEIKFDDYYECRKFVIETRGYKYLIERLREEA